MKERDLVDIVAITFAVDNEGIPAKNYVEYWRHGWLHPQTYAELLHRPPWVILEDTPMQLEGIGGGVRFGIIDILSILTPTHWDSWRSKS